MPLPPISPSGVLTAFIYGRQTSAGTGWTGLVSAIPPSVNHPIFFEPGPLFTDCLPKLLIIVTGPQPNWGGAQVWASADGSTYGQIGTVTQGGVQGVLTADFPVGSDPDTSHSIEVDVSESGQQIISASDTDADLGISLAYVGTAGTAFELVGYSNATLDSTSNYDLDTYLRRGMYGSTIVDHPTTSPFGLVNGSVFSIVLNQEWCGKTFFFKFPSFNTVGGMLQDLSTVTAYSYTVTCAGVCPSGSPVATSCALLTVLAGGACCVDLGSLGECVASMCDLGVLGQPVMGCIDLGVLGT